MRKRILTLTFIWLALLTACTLPAIAQQTDLQKEWLAGPVKSVYIRSFKAVKQGNEIMKGEHEWQGSEFDVRKIYNKQGYSIEAHSFDAEGKPSRIIYEKRDAEGKELESAVYEIEEDGDKELASKVTFTYNSHGNRTVEHVENYKGYYTRKGEDTIVDYYFDYNSANKIVKQHGGRYGMVTLYKYNALGLLIEEQVLDDKGRMFIQKLYAYNKQCEKIEERETRITLHNGLSSTECWKYKWNNHGLISEFSNCDANCNPIDKATLVYDEQKRLVKHQYLDTNGGIKVTFTYRYKDDQFGNWVVKFVFVDGKPTDIVEREIRYYN